MPVQPATNTNVYGQQGTQSASDAMQNVDLNDFLKLMIAELQNQDPMNPMDNAQMLQQIGQIREIASNDKLSTSLDAVLLGQNLTTATNLVGQWVAGMTDEGETVMGTVERTAIEDGEAILHVLQRVEAYYNEETGETVPATTNEYDVSLKNLSYVMRDDVDLKQMSEKIAAASSLVGRTIIGVTEDDQTVTGNVDQIEIEDRTVQLVVGDYRIELGNLTHVLDDETTTETTTETNEQQTTTE